MDVNAALDAETALLVDVSRHPERRYIRFWQSSPALVAPQKTRTKPSFQVAARAMAELGWPVHLRTTGGDVTPQGPGIVNVTLVFAGRRGTRPDPATTYDLLCGPIERALGSGASRGWNPGAFCDGAYNVQMNGLKFAGTAQRYRRCTTGDRYAVLAHALMLMKPPDPTVIAALNRFLTLLGETRPVHVDRHTGLPCDLPQAVFISRLNSAFRDALRAAT